MKDHLKQLLADIASATANVTYPWNENAVLYGPEWKNEEMDRQTAPRKSLEDWTGIRKSALPPDNELTDEEVSQLLAALEKLLAAYHCNLFFIFVVPDRIVYRAVRARFDQESPFLQWHDHSFEFCEPGQEHFTCALGEYCECGRRANWFATFREEEDLLPMGECEDIPASEIGS